MVFKLSLMCAAQLLPSPSETSLALLTSSSSAFAFLNRSFTVAIVLEASQSGSRNDSRPAPTLTRPASMTTRPQAPMNQR